LGSTDRRELIKPAIDAGAFHPEAASFRTETGALGSGPNLLAFGGWHVF
jgi:hypothetical protein